jgi:hypothetical protein
MIALSIFNPIKIDMTYKSTICKTTTTNGLDKENLFMRRLVFSYQRVRNREKYQSPDSRGIEEGPDSEEEGKRGSQLPLGCSHPAATDLARKRSPPLWPSGLRRPVAAWRGGGGSTHERTPVRAPCAGESSSSRCPRPFVDGPNTGGPKLHEDRKCYWATRP